jgi:hypothetical protein
MNSSKWAVIIARARQGQPFAFRPLAEQRVGHLDKDAGAIAQQRVRAHRPAMVDVLENFQRLGDDRMAFGALDMGDEAHTAGVVFVTRIVKPLGLRKLHRYNPSCLRRPQAGGVGVHDSPCRKTGTGPRTSPMTTGRRFCNREEKRWGLGTSVSASFQPAGRV